MALYGGLAENTRRNERMERGTVTFTGSTTITVSPPMRQIIMVDITQILGTSPGVGPQNFTYTLGTGANTNQFTIFAWQPTSNANPTLVAGTTPCTVAWNVLGNLSAGQGF